MLLNNSWQLAVGAEFCLIGGDTGGMTYRSRLVFPALVAAGVLWGTTVPLSKLALAWLAPGWLAFARFALAAALLMVISRSRLRGAFRPAILITGAAGYGGMVLLQNLGIERTSVTHAALLIGATPVLVAVLATMLGLGRARPIAWLGFGLSLAGVSVIAAGRGAGSSLAGDGLVLAAQLAAAGFTVSQARLLRGRDPVAVTALQLTAAAVAVLPAALAGGPAQVAAATPTAMLATAGLVLAGTVLPTTMFAFAQSRVAPAVAGAFLNLEPLVGAAVGIVLFGNPLGPAQIVGGAAVAAGLGLSSCPVVKAERTSRSAPAVAPSRAADLPAGLTAGPEATSREAALTARPGATSREAAQSAQIRATSREAAPSRPVLVPRGPRRRPRPFGSATPAGRMARFGEVCIDEFVARPAGVWSDPAEQRVA
jgi:O-acetylserine/cysteine efflux transporter